jgi:ribonuclease HII
MPIPILVAGVDEVGRGALFGPVVAAVVVISSSRLTELEDLGVKDSKQLTPKSRIALVPQIQKVALASQIGLANAIEIDRLNILQASLLAMRRAVMTLKVKPDLCLIDGINLIPDLDLPQESIVRGDCLSPAIAAASIIAKVWRDRAIERLARRYPQYDLAANKGYGTKKHLLGLEKYGVSPQHRLSFRPVSSFKRSDFERVLPDRV